MTQLPQDVEKRFNARFINSDGGLVDTLDVNTYKLVRRLKQNLAKELDRVRQEEREQIQKKIMASDISLWEQEDINYILNTINAND